MRSTFSVITVVRNHAEGLIATIRSVLSQQDAEIEYIVIDGASTDHTRDVILQFSRHIDHLVSEPDKGIYDAMNKGIDRATGQWIHFLNCEDMFHEPDTLSNIGSILEKDDGVVFGQCFNVNSGKVHNFKPPHLYWAGMTFDHQAAVVRADIYKALKYDLRYKINADFDFFSRARVAGYKFREIERIVGRKPYTGGFSDDPLARLRERFSIARRHFPAMPIADQLMLEILNAK